MPENFSARWRPPDGGPPSVLLIDDHADAVESLAELLRLVGYDARVASHADDALAAELTDVVILELRLPDRDGWELVRQMQTRSPDKRPLYIAVTTCGREIDRRKSYEAGIDLHLLKPVEPDHLLSILNRFAPLPHPVGA